MKIVRRTEYFCIMMMKKYNRMKERDFFYLQKNKH